MGKHGLQAVMLADPDVKVILEMGISNQAFPAINAVVNKALPGNVKVLPIPTTVLIDAAGTVRWIDQSENYQQRADPDKVLGALKEHLG